MRRSIWTALGLMSLAACGGSGASPMVEDVTFGTVLGAAETVFDGYDLARATDAPTTTTGSVSYTGFAELAEFEQGETDHVYTALGLAEIVVDFDTNDISLDVQDLFETDDRVLPSLLNSQPVDGVSGEVVAGTFAMDVDASDVDTTRFDGTLTKSNGEVASYDLQLFSVEAWGPSDEIFEGGARGNSTAEGRDTRDALLIFVGER